MTTDLKSCLARLAISPDKFSEFAADPKLFAEKSGLSLEDQTILLSGDQNKIYLALRSQDQDSENSAK